MTFAVNSGDTENNKNVFTDPTDGTGVPLGEMKCNGGSNDGGMCTGPPDCPNCGKCQLAHQGTTNVGGVPNNMVRASRTAGISGS
jgi:hypothetical protein